MKSLAAIIGMGLLVSVHAGSVVSIVPQTKTHISLSEKDSFTVRYLVINHGIDEKKLSLKHQRGIEQILLNSKSCSSPMVLASGKACELVLKITTGTRGTPVESGPKLCTDKQCYSIGKTDALYVAPSKNMLANISVTPKRILLSPQEKTHVTVTNLSQIHSAYNINILTQKENMGLMQDNSSCKSLPPNGSCQIILSQNKPIQQDIMLNVSGKNTSTATLRVQSEPTPKALLAIDAQQSNLPDSQFYCNNKDLLNCFITLFRNGPTKVISVTNTSTRVTAQNVTAIFTGTALDGNVTVNTCPIVPPGGVCNLAFTPGNTAVPMTEFVVRGDNTPAALASMEILSVPISCDNASATGCQLTMPLGLGAQILTITNNTIAPVTNISAHIAGTPLDGAVTQDASDCANVPGGASCNLVFTPVTTAPLTNVLINGDNTDTIQGSIEVVGATISCAGGCNLTLFPAPHGPSGSLTINVSVAVATDILPELAGTALDGNVSLRESTCANVSPGDSCTLTFKSDNANFVAPTNFNISGTDTNTVIGQISVAAPNIGDTYHGGTVGCFTQAPGGNNCDSDANCNLISSNILSPPEGTAWGAVDNDTGANSDLNGANNTTAMVTAMNTPAATLCSNYEVDVEGNTPCVAPNICYNDWFLPASRQLLCIHSNLVPIGDLPNLTYWSSTQYSLNPANGADFVTSFGIFPELKSFTYNIVCATTFTPPA